ncbi:hypothetical protein YC2023_118078 [Brassica napus]
MNFMYLTHKTLPSRLMKVDPKTFPHVRNSAAPIGGVTFFLKFRCGLRDSDGSFGGKAQATSSNSTLGTLLSPFHITESLRF